MLKNHLFSELEFFTTAGGVSGCPSGVPEKGFRIIFPSTNFSGACCISPRFPQNKGISLPKSYRFFGFFLGRVFGRDEIFDTRRIPKSNLKGHQFERVFQLCVPLVTYMPNFVWIVHPLKKKTGEKLRTWLWRHHKHGILGCSKFKDV